MGVDHVKFLAFLRKVLPLFSPVVFIVLNHYLWRSADCNSSYIFRVEEVVDYSQLLAEHTPRDIHAIFSLFLLICFLTIGLAWWDKRFRIPTIMLLMLIVPIVCLGLIFACRNPTAIRHVQNVSFNGAVYQLAEETTDYGDYILASYLIYECDPTGKKCVPKGWSSYPDGDYYRPEAGLLMDGAGKLLYFQFEGKSRVVAVKDD